MGIFDFIVEKKKQKEEAERIRTIEEQKQRDNEKQRIAIELEEKRLLEIEQAKNREAYAKLRGNDNERLRIGAQWLIENEIPIKKASITKIGKESKDYYYEIPYSISTYDIVRFTEETDFNDNFESKVRYVVNYGDSDIGELSKSVYESISDNDINDLIGIVTKVDDADDNFKIMLSIYSVGEFGEPGYRQLKTYIAGTKFDNVDGTSRQQHIAKLLNGEQIKLVTSEYEGSPAVEVRSARDFVLGYLKADFAKEFCRRIENNEIGGVYAVKPTNRDGVWYSDIVINIAKFPAV